jgi:predicted phage terminase large subunit-like protein
VKVTAAMVKGLVGSLLSSSFDEATKSPQFHEECWELCCSKAPRVAIGAPRGHAKTSGITLGYGISTLLFQERKFMVLVSDTEAQASLFLGAFKQQLQDNQELIDLFGLEKTKDGKALFIKDTETDIIVQFQGGKQFRIIAKGAEQKLRGLLWNGSRPDIILGDDMENDELVLNKERREKMRRWFYGALLPCLSPSGVIRLVGTVLHMDSLLERLMPENQLLGNRRNSLKWDSLKTWTDYPTPWKSIRYKAHNADYSEILWPERYDAKYFQDKYVDYVVQGIPDAYSQEYLNTPLDEDSMFFKRHDFLSMSDDDKKKNLHYYITVDLAITKDDKADWSVFLVSGVDESRNIYVVNVIRERLDAREIVDTLLALQTKYDPMAVGIEDSQVTKSIGPFLKEEMISRNIFLNLVNLKHGGKDKVARARSIQARMRARGVKFASQEDWFPNFQEELMQFPRGKHDDQVDCFAYLGLMLLQLIEAPTKEELKNEEYYEELEHSYGDHGKSTVCGY